MDVVIVVVVLALVGLAATFGGLSGGRALRQRIITRTGRDPADNRVNNGVNRFAKAHPVWMALVVVALVGAWIALRVLRLMD